MMTVVSLFLLSFSSSSSSSSSVLPSFLSLFTASMRPPVPDLVRPCKTSSVEHPPAPAATGPSTFFLARDSPDYDDHDHDHDTLPSTSEDGMYGVQSLNETLQQAEPLSSSCCSSDDDDILLDIIDNDETTRSRQPLAHVLGRLEYSRRDGSQSSLSLHRSSLSDDIAASPPRALTPFNLDDPSSSSLPSSPKSLSIKPLDDVYIPDDLSNDLPAESQLVMPSIRMPSRRPFTEQGKSMGRFKVLIAGGPGELYPYT